MDANQVLRQFTELLPTVKNEVDSFEVDIKAFEVLGLDRSSLERIAGTRTRIDALESGIGDIAKRCNVCLCFFRAGSCYLS